MPRPTFRRPGTLRIHPAAPRAEIGIFGRCHRLFALALAAGALPARAQEFPLAPLIARLPGGTRSLAMANTDQRRAAYRDSVAFRTRAVDASPFAQMSPQQARERKEAWGFDIEHTPLNAGVW